MRRGLIAASGLLLAGAAAAFAQSAPTAPMMPARPPLPAIAPIPPMPPTVIRTLPPKTRAESTAAARAQFATLDRNKDGFVTRDELPPMPATDRMGGMQSPMPLMSSMPPMPAATGQAGTDMLFTMMDTDRNGQISKAEFDAFHAGHTSHTIEVTRDKDGHERRSERMIVMRGDGSLPGAMPPPLPPGAPPMPPIGLARLDGMMLALRFDRLDINHDGKLSAQEVEAGALARFDRMDSDHDGTLSIAEIEAARPRVAIRMHRMPPPAEAARRGPGYDLPVAPPAPVAPPTGQ